VLRTFKSKKNKVLLVEKESHLYVLKVYNQNSAMRAKKEFDVLHTAHSRGIKVPKPLFFWDRSALLLEYIPGESLCDVLNNSPSLDYAHLLASWYASFHFSTGGSKEGLCPNIKGDSILRNFIYVKGASSRDCLYGVDFEEADQGEPAVDIGEICASILNTDPMFSAYKISLCRETIRAYICLTDYCPPKPFSYYIGQALRNSARWRPHQREFLLRGASVLEEHGLEIGPTLV
jgi:tRNA A-37 threonylcarbamoyl transferase component Bud32